MGIHHYIFIFKLFHLTHSLQKVFEIVFRFLFFYFLILTSAFVISFDYWTLVLFFFMSVKRISVFIRLRTLITLKLFNYFAKFISSLANFSRIGMFFTAFRVRRVFNMFIKTRISFIFFHTSSTVKLLPFFISSF